MLGIRGPYFILSVGGQPKRMLHLNRSDNTKGPDASIDGDTTVLTNYLCGQQPAGPRTAGKLQKPCAAQSNS